MAERELKVKFTGDTSGLTRSLSGAEKATKSAGDKIASAGKAMAAGFAVAGAAGFAFATKSVNTYKTVGGEVQKLKRYTGDSAQGASRLRAAFKLTGIDTEKAGKALGLFSKNLVAGKLDGFNKSLTGNRTQAKKVQAAMEQLADAQKDYQDVQKNGKSNAEDLQKSLEKVSDAQGKLTNLTQGAGDAIGSLGFKTRDAQGHLLPMSVLLPKVADVFKNMPDGAEKTALAMDLFGKAGADMLPFLNKGADGIAELEKQSDKLGTTLSGKDLDAIKESKKQSRLWSLAMEGLQIQIGRYVLPILNDFMGWVNEKGIPGLHAIGAKIKDWLEPKLKALGEWWDKKGKKAWDDFVKWIDKELLPKLEDLGKGFVDNVLDVLERVGKWVKDHPDWAVPIASGILAIAAAIKIFGLSTFGTPWGMVLLMILGIAAALYTAYQTNEDFHDSVDDFIDDISGKWKKISDSFQNDFLEPMKEKGQSFYDDFLDPLWHAVNWVVDYIGLAWQGLQETWDSISGLLVDSWHGLQETWHDTVRGISGQVLILQGWWNVLVNGARGAVSLLDGLWNGWVVHFGGVALRIGGLSDIIKGIWNGIVTVASAVVRLLAGLWNGFVINFGGSALQIGGLANTITSSWNGVYNALAIIVGGIGRLLGYLGGYIDTALQKLQTLRNWAANLAPSMPSWVPDWIPGASGSMFVPVPAPPALAAGGIIPGSKWGTLVRAGENNRAEAIVPLSKMGGTTQNTYNITVDVAPGADPVRAGAAVVDAIRSYERANGRGWRVAPA